MTLADPIRQQARERPDAPALVTSSETWTWADLDARIDACSSRLEGERIAVRAETSPALVVLILACLRSGRTVVPVSTRWPEAAAEAALARLGPDCVLGPAEVAVLQNVGDGSSYASGEGPGEERTRRATSALDLARPFTIVHTSGSTGRPKSALHTVGNHVWSARGVIERMDLREGDRWLLDLPLYHVGGLGVVVRCALAGATLTVPERGTSTADAVRQLRPTHASLVSTQLRRLLHDASDNDLAGLRAVLLGGSAIPPELLDEAVRRGLPVATSYGMTEMTSTVTATAPGASRDDLATSGTLLPHRALRISASGEIEVSGPTRFAGYATSSGVEPAPEWVPTGDLGRLDADGRLVVTGRRDLRFVSGGENVQPEAIEAALLALDAIAEAVVLPVPDAEYGARPVAFVRLADGIGLDPSALATALREHLAGFMIPVAFYAWNGAEGMKPNRPALQAEAERRAAETSGAGGRPQPPTSNP